MDRLLIPVLTVAAAEVLAVLARRPGLEIVAVVVDVTGDRGLDAVHQAALDAGARRCHVVDKHEELADAVLWPALRAGSLGVPGEPVLTALSVPVVAEAVVEISRREQATGVAVWLDDLRDRQRLRALVRDLAPTLGLVAVTAPAGATIASVGSHVGVERSASGQGRSGVTRNLWARIDTRGSGTPAVRPEAAFVDLRIGFARGVPMSLNGVTLAPAALIQRLDAVVGGAGAGAWTVRGSASAASWHVQAPAALALAMAMETLTARTFDARTAEVAATMAEAYAEVIRDGAWFSPVRAALDAFVDRVLAAAAGEVGLRIVNGRIEVQA